MRVQKPDARSFCEVECAKARWSVRELERQIASLLWERLALSRDKEGLLELAEQGHSVYRPEDLIKDPYVLEFTGFPEPESFQVSDLSRFRIPIDPSNRQSIPAAVSDPPADPRPARMP